MTAITKFISLSCLLSLEIFGFNAVEKWTIWVNDIKIYHHIMSSMICHEVCGELALSVMDNLSISYMGSGNGNYGLDIIFLTMASMILSDSYRLHYDSWLFASFSI